ncbi:hypothetical protein [Thauera butanivorans]|uniref:hypothetical protein n=1 Tax=Thauera butanivorans TaxID=86174 RepID=UPI0012FCD926|nr:hypothetical protein [Thauera butanivorans]
MKNKLLVLLLGAAFSSMSLADPVVLSPGEVNTIAGIGGDGELQCDLLSETVRVGLSANVRGVIECNTEDSVTAIATCHTAGRKVFNAPITDAETGAVTPTDVTQGIIFTSSSLGGKIGVVEGDGCTGDGGLTTASAEAATPPTP